MRIALSGKMASGKSLVAEYLVREHGFIELAFATKMKEIAAILFPRTRYEKDRWLLQQVGERLREIDSSVWVRQLLPDIIPDKNILVSDVRFPLEYETLKQMGFVMVRMKASYRARLKYVKQVYPDMPLVLMDDPSETILDSYPFNYEIDNDVDVSLELVHKQVDAMMSAVQMIK